MYVRYTNPAVPISTTTANTDSRPLPVVTLNTLGTKCTQSRWTGQNAGVPRGVQESATICIPYPTNTPAAASVPTAGYPAYNRPANGTAANTSAVRIQWVQVR